MKKKIKTSKVILNMDKQLKLATMKKARQEGLSLTGVLNIAARAYVSNRLKITALDKDLEEGLEDVRRGKAISQEELFKKLGL